MNTLEWLVLAHLHPLVGPFMDPLQFAYQPGIGVYNTIVLLLDRSLSHLEKPGPTSSSVQGTPKSWWWISTGNLHR